MIKYVMTFSHSIKKYFSHTKELPLINRIFAYVLFLMASILLIASVAFCAVMAWGAIEALLNGNIFDNEPAQEWDIR